MGEKQSMISKIKYGKSTIPYSVIKSKRRKTSQIIVDESGVVVQTPFTKKNSEIKKMVENQKAWIFKKQLTFSDRAKRKQFQIKTRTTDYLEKRAWKLASKIGITPYKVVVKKLKSRWGSATKTGTINLNESLTKTPLPVIDYIIIHELCHLKIDDHSQRFWNLLYKHDKNYQDKINWLDANGDLLADKK